MPVTMWLTSGVTPKFSSELNALADSFSGNAASTRSPASTRSTRVRLVSKLRKSFWVSRAISAICPAISTPVGPAPTTTKVSWRSRSASVSATSAVSKARRICARMCSAPSSDFSSAACSCHSGWPK